MKAPTRITFPKRWPRRKRKAVRATTMAALWRAWYWANLTAAMKTYMEKTWSDPPPSIDWGELGFKVTESEAVFVDDAEFKV